MNEIEKAAKVATSWRLTLACSFVGGIALILAFVTVLADRPLLSCVCMGLAVINGLLIHVHDGIRKRLQS